MKDLYKILNVAEDADDDTIKKAYRKLAKENHPDATGGDKRKTERFKEVNEAYSVLGDKQKRSEYDRLKHAPVGADGMPQGFDPDTFAQVFGGNFGGGRGNVHVSTDFGGDIGDLFASLFGRGFAGAGGGRGAGRERGPRAARGQDMVGTIEITFGEAALGTRRTIRSGGGATVDVAIPPGVETGGRLRLPNQGAPSPATGGQAGDLHLEVRVTPDPNLRRAAPGSLDVEIDVPLTVPEAALGTKVNVPTVEGSVQVTIPPGTSSGARLRLRGKGIKKPDGTRGDQLCVVQVVVPKLSKDDEEARRALEQLARAYAKPVRNF